MSKENYVKKSRDDDKELVVIDYYDRIHKQWIKVEVTKEVARLLKNETQRERRKQNAYDYYNLPFDEVFDSTKKDYEKKEHLLVDENSEIRLEAQDELMFAEMEEEQRRTIIENSLCCLTPEQREVVELAYYQNMSYGDIGKLIGITKPAVYKRMKNAEKNIRDFIEKN